MFGWYAFSFYYLTGNPYPQELSVTLSFVCYIIALIAWKFARPATSIESLTLTKVTNASLIVLFALKLIHVYKYHIVDVKQQLFPRRMWKHLHEEEGYTSINWFHFMTFLEAFADGSTIIFIGLTVYCFQQYISGKMVLADRLKKALEAGDSQALEAAKKQGATWVGGNTSSSASSSNTRRRRGRA
ncbi:hypothetical protein DUNSADRAFT_9668 [Dunaliella salina]|uniref:Uncharacterized protein n=1 Tax=Dunaliella salina TaxID=3046 RepID=A0ABQ7GGZ5_DUNSA|nr:hypothetical protein DUNSADRAFT_9668 [Dunaliella salina]|eukprot:KAF5833873.1 hypothetical protein DUNSADRAFT_9668 [Dunaliella salina]